MMCLKKKKKKKEKTINVDVALLMCLNVTPPDEANDDECPRPR